MCDIFFWVTCWHIEHNLLCTVQILSLSWCLIYMPFPFTLYRNFKLSVANLLLSSQDVSNLRYTLVFWVVHNSKPIIATGTCPWDILWSSHHCFILLSSYFVSKMPQVDVAELRQKLQSMDALEKEVELLRRQRAASEQAAMDAKQRQSSGGMWGWLAGSPTPAV
jgi:hypothetical protein